MPTFLVTGTVPVEVKAVTNWDSDHTTWLNGEIRFDAKNVASARVHIAKARSENRISSVHALYLVRGEKLLPMQLLEKKERSTILLVLETIFEEDKRTPLLRGLSDGELEELLRSVRGQVWNTYGHCQKRQELIENILKVLKPKPGKREQARMYLKEFSEDVLDHILTHVENWRREDRKKMFISSFLSGHLRPAVSKELFDQ